MRWRRALWAHIATLLVGVRTDAAPAGASIDASVETYTLANGLTVVLAPDASVATIHVHAWYAAGSDDDPRGLAAIVERLMFRGSTHVAPGAFEQTIERAGGWVDVAGATDHTSCIAQLPAGALSTALQLEAERMFGLVIDAKRVDEARAEIERESADLALDVAIDRAIDPQRAPRLGDVGLRAVTVNDVEAYHRTHFAPGATTLVVTGRFDAKRARAEVERDFAWMPATAAAPSKKPETRTPLAAPVELAIATGLPKVIVAFRAPARSMHESRALDAIAQLLGGTRGRLARELVDQKLATDVRVDHAIGDRFTIEVVLAPSTDPNRARDAIARQLAALRATPIDAADLARVHGAIELRFVESLENLAFRAEAFARWSRAGDVHHVGAELGELRVTADEIRAVATTWLADTAAVTVLPPVPEKK